MPGESAPLRALRMLVAIAIVIGVAIGIPLACGFAFGLVARGYDAGAP